MTSTTIQSRAQERMTAIESRLKEAHAKLDLLVAQAMDETENPSFLQQPPHRLDHLSREYSHSSTLEASVERLESTADKLVTFVEEVYGVRYQEPAPE